MSSPPSKTLTALLMCCRSICTLRAAGGISAPWSWMRYMPRSRINWCQHPSTGRPSRTTEARLHLYLYVHSPSWSLKRRKARETHQTLALAEPSAPGWDPGHPSRTKALLLCRPLVGSVTFLWFFLIQIIVFLFILHWTKYCTKPSLFDNKNCRILLIIKKNNCLY